MGNTSPGTNVKTETEQWNGTNWTEVNDLNTGRISLSGFGTYTSAIASAGYVSSPTKLAVTELWNGTNWTETTDLSNARYQAAAAGADNTSGLVTGGESQAGASLAATEEWTGAGAPIGVWAAGGSMNTGRSL